MGNAFYKECCNEKDDYDEINKKIRNGRKRYFILSKGDFLEIDRIYEKHELHELTECQLP